MSDTPSVPHPKTRLYHEQHLENVVIITINTPKVRGRDLPHTPSQSWGGIRMESVERCPMMLTMVDTQQRTAGIPRGAIHTTPTSSHRHLAITTTAILTTDTPPIHTGNRGTIDKYGATR